MIHTPKDILLMWIDAVNQGDVEKLLELYDSQAVLIPTFSNRILNTSDKLRDYFEKLATRKSLSVTLHENTLIVQKIKEDVYILSGLYNWRFDVDGALLNFEARFSYGIDTSSVSPILHHHSSQIPRTL